MQQENSTLRNNPAGRLLYLVDEHAGGKHTIFAKKAGIPPSTFQGYLQGRMPHVDHLLRIRETYGANIDWIMSGEGSIYVQGEGRVKETSETPITPEEEEEGREYVRVPRYEVAASAGGGAFVESEQIVDYLSFRSEWVRNALGVSLNALALINVIGDSMEPTLSDGDVVLLDTTLRGVQDSAIYVMQLNGTLLVKRIQHRLDGSLEVMSDNSRYKPETVSGEAINQLKIIGRVVWAGRKM